MHCFPHAPQWSTAASVFTHRPSQHVFPSSHLFLQLPQVPGSEVRSTQVALSSVPQQVGVFAGQGVPVPHWQSFSRQMLAASPHSSSLQQMPAKHSPPQQSLPSPQRDLLGRCGWVQTPLALQTLRVHGLPSSGHSAPSFGRWTQRPRALQTSLVQGLPSSGHLVPSGLFWVTHRPWALQTILWQGFVDLGQGFFASQEHTSPRKQRLVQHWPALVQAEPA
jgi:hypothetical protein